MDKELKKTIIKVLIWVVVFIVIVFGGKVVFNSILSDTNAINKEIREKY